MSQLRVNNLPSRTAVTLAFYTHTPSEDLDEMEELLKTERDRVHHMRPTLEWAREGGMDGCVL